MSYIYHTPNIFKHYSGKGLTKKGSCTLDENGILSNVNRGGDGCYVTSFKMTNLSKPFTLQVKAYVVNPNDTTSVLLTSSNSGWNIFTFSGIRPNLYTSISVNPYNNSTTYSIKGTYPDNLNFQDLKSKWLYYIAKFDGKLYYFELRDENYKLLAHDDGLKLGCSINNNNEYLIIGNDISSDASTSWTKGTLWDLSETWIKDASGKVISPWNLD